MNCCFRLGLTLLSLLQVTLLHAGDATSPVAPYLDDEVVSVGKLDLRAVDVAATTRLLEKISPPNWPEFKQALSAGEPFAQKRVDELRKAGVQEVYSVLAMSDIPVRPPLVLFMVKSGGDPSAVASLLSWAGFAVREPVGSVVLCGQREQVQRARAAWQLRRGAHKTDGGLGRPPYSTRPDLEQALANAGSAPLALVAALTPDNRRVIREMLAPLPKDLGGLTGPQLAEGLQSLSLSAELAPKLSIRATIQAKDADAAKAFTRTIEAGMSKLRQEADVRKVVPQIDAVTHDLLPVQQGTRLELTLDQEKLQRLVALFGRAVKEARGSAQRTQSANNLRQIGLALHQYYDKHKRLPPQASYSPDGKKLLSWRVQLMPFLGEDALYRQFRLNEPWDSPHNRTLIGKMPRVLASPLAPPDLAAKGMTTYLAPVGEKTVFSTREGTRFEQVTDGTSNTIAVVEVAPSAAVIWTSPNDLDVDMKAPLRHLTGQRDNRFPAAFCDGSVRKIPDTVDPETLRRAFQMNDGKPVQLP